VDYSEFFWGGLFWCIFEMTLCVGVWMGGNLKLGNRRDIFGGNLAVYFMISRLVSFSIAL